MTEYINLIENHIKEKKHIIITGSRGIGKTTLLNEVRETIEKVNCAPGLVTWAEPGRAVFAKELGQEEYVMVGEFDPNSLSPENRMKPALDGFDVYGVSILDNLINSDSEWVTIDEIGYLEGTSPLYLRKLEELFIRKRVLAVVRKQKIKHINAIIKREDVFVIDLD